MILVRAVGGLGNQMFQYAAGRALADRLGVELLLDLRDFKNYRLHCFGLDGFRIRGRKATADEMEPWPEWRRRLSRRLSRIGLPSRFYFEPSFGYDPVWSTLGDGVHLNGYFQSERYFAERAAQLRDDFTLVEPLRGENAEIAALARRCESVAIHVRRGDYLTDVKTLSFHGVCSPMYYREAISLIRVRYNNPRFFVFSNDMQWARANLRLGGDALFVSGGDRTPQIDVYLMANCRHHVIANSSFSWWGAWLGRHSEQCVVAPTPWFDSPLMKDDDLLPSAWLRARKA